MNRTVQGQPINELALAGITTAAAANGYLTERFIPDYNAEFAHPPADPTPAFGPLHGVRLIGRMPREPLDGPQDLYKQPVRHNLLSVWESSIPSC